MKRISDYFKRPSAALAAEPVEDSRNEAEMEEEGDELDSDDALAEEANMRDATEAGDATTHRRKKYKFNVDWQKTFPWLLFENNLMYCKYCREQKKNAGTSVFVTGNPNLKRDTVLKHSKSNRHLACRDASIAAENKPLQVAVRRQVVLAEEEVRRQLKIKINIAYHIAKEELPFVKFHSMMVLHKKNGVDINPTYDNDKRCAEMIGQIADTMKQSLAQKLREAPYLAVLIDGDSDISNIECEIVYCRLLENGTPKNILVGQQTLEHSHAIGKQTVVLYFYLLCFLHLYFCINIECHLKAYSLFFNNFKKMDNYHRATLLASHHCDVSQIILV